MIGSVAAVAADDHKDHDNIDGSARLRATKGSRSDQQATATALFDDVELESDTSAQVKKDNKSHFVPADELMLLDEEIQLALEGLDEDQRNIQLAAYVDYKQNHMNMEEINMKYRTHGDDNLDVRWEVIPCCKIRTGNSKCYGKYGDCTERCRWLIGMVSNYFANGCCDPDDRGKKFFIWEICR